MIICKRCEYKYRLNISKRESRCPQCDFAIDFGKFKSVNRARLLLKALCAVVYWVFFSVVLLLYHWMIYNGPTLPRRFLIGLLLATIVVLINNLALIPMAQRIIMRMYYEEGAHTKPNEDDN